MAAFDVFMSYPTAEGYSDFIDITDDVLESSLGDIKQALEADEFNVGKITFDSFDITLRNEDATYSEAANATSIFPIKRDQTIIRVEWNINSYPEACGNTPCGLTFLSTKRNVFKGLIEENSASFDVVTQEETFRVLGMDSVINKEPTPFSVLDVSDDMNTLVFKILNQDRITRFFLVDQANISCKFNFVANDISYLEGTTCLKSLQEIFKLSNSIMFVKDDIVYVKERSESVDSKFTFYGNSSNEGIENISKISDYGTGLNRTFNYWRWGDTSLVRFFADSVDLHGTREKSIDSELVTDPVIQTAILDSYLGEFGFPKTELKLTVPMYTPIVDLSFLDKINIDYPSEVLPTLTGTASKYNQARYDSGFKYNRILNSLFISVSQDWKILNKVTKTKKQVLEFKIRRV